MGKKGNWFVAVKKAFSPESKEKKEQKSSKSKNKWRFRNKKHADTSSSLDDILAAAAAAVPQRTQNESLKLAEAEKEQSKHAYSVALATAAAAEVAVAAAHAAAEMVRLTAVPRYRGRSPEEVAAIRIQTAFRGYLARRALRALRGLVRLKTLINGESVRRQASTTLRYMQTLARVQSQIRTRRTRVSEDNQALQRQLQLKSEKDIETSSASMGGNWDYGMQSKEQTEARLLRKQDAAARRERALAYAYSHQQAGRNAPRSGNPTFLDPNNPQWGWSWLERWMAARPWESQSTTEKEHNDNSSVKSATHSVGGGSISKAYARSRVDKPWIPTRQSPSRAAKPKAASPKIDIWTAADDDSRSTVSMQSDRNRRHSIAGSSVRDDESLASCPSVPSYMTPTESVKARARVQSPLGTEKVETPDKGSSAASAKKRLSFPASPAAPRRHSGPPRVDSSSIKGTTSIQPESLSNGSNK